MGAKGGMDLHVLLFMRKGELKGTEGQEDEADHVMRQRMGGVRM